MINVLIRNKSDRQHLTMYFIDPVTQREVTRSAGTADIKQAIKNASRWEDELKAKRGAHDDGWEWFVDRFEQEHLANLAENTGEAYTTALNCFRRFWKGDSLSDITPTVLSQFQSWLRDDGYPVSTIKSYLRHLKAALNWARKMRIIAEVPTIFMPKGTDASKGRPLTDAEYAAFLEACPDPQWVRFAEMIRLAGFRLEEAFIASWDGDRIRVEPDAKPHPRIWFRADSHKARRDQFVPMTPDFHAWLLKTAPSQRQGLICPLFGECKSRPGEPFTSANGAGKVMSRIGESTGIVTGRRRGLPSYASTHDLRRTFGTKWALMVKPLTLKCLMRHVDISTTLKYYVHLSTEDIAKDVWSAVPTNVPNQAQIRELMRWAECDFPEENQP